MHSTPPVTVKCAFTLLREGREGGRRRERWRERERERGRERELEPNGTAGLQGKMFHGNEHSRNKKHSTTSKKH